MHLSQCLAHTECLINVVNRCASGFIGSIHSELWKHKVGYVLVSKDLLTNYYSKLPQTWWLETTLLIFLQLWRLGCSQFLRTEAKELAGPCFIHRLYGRIHSLPFLDSGDRQHFLAYASLQSLPL